MDNQNCSLEQQRPEYRCMNAEGYHLNHIIAPADVSLLVYSALQESYFYTQKELYEGTILAQQQILCSDCSAHG
jgi:hypothetical protein